MNPTQPRIGAHGDEVGDIERVGGGWALAQRAESGFGHGAVACHVKRQRPGGDEGPEALDDPIAGDGDGTVQPREVLGAFGKRQDSPKRNAQAR